MSLSPLVTFLTTAARKASRLLYRDYFELEQIQSSVRPATDFALRSEKKVKELLLKELLKYPNAKLVDGDIPQMLSDIVGDEAARNFNIVIISGEKTRSRNIYDDKSESQIYFVIHPIDGIENLTRAIPFFATIIIAYEYKNSKITPIASIVNSPALGEIIYASKGFGVLMERTIDQNSDYALRMRASMTSKIEQAMVISESIDCNYSEFISEAKESQEIPKKLPGEKFKIYKQRSIGCDIYGACMVASGKADIFLSSENINKVVIAASEIIIKESGGATYRGKIFDNKEYSFIASNGKIL